MVRCSRYSSDSRRCGASRQASFGKAVEVVPAKLQVAAMRQWLRGAAAIGGGAIARVPSSRRNSERGRARGRGETRGEGSGGRGASYPLGARHGSEWVEREQLARAATMPRCRYRARSGTTGNILFRAPWPFFFSFIPVLFIFYFLYLI